jgi:hypothetical protein
MSVSILSAEGPSNTGRFTLFEHRYRPRVRSHRPANNAFCNDMMRFVAVMTDMFG